jgi:hypothetical protein
MRQTFPCVLVLLALACGLGAATAAATDGEPAPPEVTGTTETTAATTTAAARMPVRSLATIRRFGTKIGDYQRTTWHWQQLMGRPRTPSAGRNLAAMSVPDVRRAVRLWQGRARAAERAAHRPPHLRAWLCIHRYEGSWWDGGAPYYGGLQMDWGFMRRYGAQLLRTKGPANRWSPLEQIWVAERAHRSGLGFYPWPNTARSCGLI